MSINNLNTYLNVRDAHLRVVSGNVYAQAMNIGGINVETAHGLQSVSNTGNATSLTLEFANVTTGFVTTANAQIGRDLVVTGNATVSKELTVTSNAIVSSNLNVSDDLIVTNNILASNNLTVTGNLNVTTIRSDSNVVAEYTGPHDRPLRKYPEVAFPLQGSSESAASGATTFTYKSYTVTSNSVYSGTNYKISNAFDGTATSWSGNLGDYDSNGDVASGRTANYLQIQLPNAIKLENIKIISEANYEYANGPRNITLYGSNNGSDWVTLKTETDLPLNGGTTNPDPQTAFVHVNTTMKYLYYKLEISKIWISSGGATYARIGEWELYGYEEGSGSLDTTLKTVYNVPATTGTQLEVYYDGQDYGPSVPTSITDKTGNGNNTTTVGSGIGFDSTYKAFTFDGTTNGKIEGTHGLGTGTGIQYSMSLWFKADVLSGNHRLATFGTQGTQYQSSTLLIYQNDIHLDHWLSEIKTTSDILVPNVWYHLVAIHTGPGTEDVSQNALYLNGVKLEDVTTGGSAANGTFNLQGTGLTIGADSAGTNPFTGSIANFRLYSKALNAEQIQELYDFQKDYFLGSKSQLTLYKGHLGIGVTEPSGQLELAGDERIQEYPPRAMTANETLVEGHGAFVTHGGHSNSAYAPWRAFNKELGSAGNFWIDIGPGYSHTAPYEALSTHSRTTLHDGSDLLGGWIDLVCPYPIKLSSVSIAPRTNYWQISLQRGVILGSNNGEDWYQIDTIDYNSPSGSTGTTAISNHLTNFGLTSTSYYSHIRLVCTHLTSQYGSSPNYDMHWQMGALVYFGTPGPTTLDKGSLSLGRSLDVPRVSRYDVDTETPRPEKLIFDYDTTVNSSPTDISGKGNHGTFYGDAYYSEADKAFKFDGTNDTVYVDRNGSSLNGFPTGDATYTMSCWMKPRVLGTSSAIFYFGSAWTTSQLAGIYFSSGNAINMDVGAYNITTASNILKANEWAHVAIVKRGTGNVNNTHSWGSIYVNGEEVPTTVVNGGGQQGLQTVDNLSIGSNFNGTPGSFGEDFDGCIAKPQIWSVPLENSEIRKLYRLGRTGRSMVISDTAVGIGKAPEAQLDVRGNLNVDGVITNQKPAFYAEMSNATSRYEGPGIAVFNDVIYNRGGCYSASTGLFTAPITGAYLFHCYGYARSSSQPWWVRPWLNGAYWARGPYSPTAAAGEWIIPMNAGDTLGMYLPTSSYGFYIGGDRHNGFSGYLIG